MNKSFSVIVPSYNNAKYIETCVDSLLNQNYDLNLIQILVIDDGSTDNTAKVMEKYKDCPAVEYYQKPNGQWGSVMNYVKKNKLIKNDFVSVLDADDFLDKNAYQIINKNVQDADVFVGTFRKWDGNKKRAKVYPYLFLFKNEFTDLNQKNTAFCTPLTFFVKKEIFYKIRDLIEGVPYQDVNLISQFMLNSKKVKFTKKTIAYYYYNRSGNSVTQPWNEKRLKSLETSLLETIKNDAPEVVAFHVTHQKHFRNWYKETNQKFVINRKMKFSWYPWYIRPFFFMVYKIWKVDKLFEIK